jgi:hypothetical protein
MVPLWLLACEEEPTKPAPTDTGEPPAPTTTGEARTGQVGSILLIEYPPDAYAGTTETTARGLFVDEEPGVLNFAECVFFGPPCLVEPGVPGQEPEQVPVPQGFLTVDAGPRLRVGGAFLERSIAQVGPIYAGEGFALNADHQLAFDGDLLGFATDEAFEVPDPLEGVSPPPEALVTLAAGQDLMLGWTPGTTGETALRWADGERVTVWPIEDTGSATLTAAELGLVPPVDATWLTLSRATHQSVDASGNTVRLDVVREQWFYVDLFDPTGFTDLTGDPRLSETCDATALLPDGQYFGTLADADADLDLGDGNPLTGYQTAGRDLSFAVDLQDGDTLEVEFRQVWLDGAVYVLGSGCDPARAQAAADVTFEGDQEVLVFTAPEAGVYHVVLDSFATDQGERFALQTRTIPAAR